MKTAQQENTMPNAHYMSLTKGGTHKITLDQEEEAAVLHAYDVGIDHLHPEEKRQVDRVLIKLKDSIWP